MYLPPAPPTDETSWEAIWAPYPESLYQEVLALLHSYDVVLDIGAGDMRLAIPMAELTQHVYAIENQASLIARAQNKNLPPHLTIFHEDACTFPFPAGITTAILLMRHCTHFRLYADKLKAIGCQKLITNARWRTGFEIIPLQTPRPFYHQIPFGWYACWCGQTGFKPGPVEALTEENFNTTYEVANCPTCSE
ncbi:MAG: hypothetical protein Fur0022_10540 [Anaerolineales bacterium]